MKIAIGTDHAGERFAQASLLYMASQGIEVVSFLPNFINPTSVDYPDFASLVAAQVAQKTCDFGVLICGTGIGMSIAANKYKGIRAAVVHDAFTARACRAHNNANILCVGDRVIGLGVFEECLRIFLSTPFEGGRHLTRVCKIEQLER